MNDKKSVRAGWTGKKETHTAERPDMPDGRDFGQSARRTWKLSLSLSQNFDLIVVGRGELVVRFAAADCEGDAAESVGVLVTWLAVHDGGQRCFAKSKDYFAEVAMVRSWRMVWT